MGAKSDITQRRVIDHATGKAFGDQFSLAFMETSAKDGTGVEEAFETLVCNITDKLMKNEPPPSSSAKVDVHTHKPHPPKKARCDL